MTPSAVPTSAVPPSQDQRRAVALPRRILIVRLGAIGDVTNALVVANALKDADPGVHIGWAVHPLSSPLLIGHPSVDQVHLWPRNSGVTGLKTLMRGIRAAGYDAALDLQRLQKSALIARFSGARRVIGFDRPRCKEQSWLWTKERIIPGPKREHMALQYMRFSGLLGVPSGTPRRSLPSPADARAFAETFKQRHGTPLLVNLGASKPDKLWPVASFRDLLDSLREGLDVSPWDSIVLTGGPGDRATARELMDSSGPVIDLVGSTSLPELWELCRASHAMVTADTGPMHLCAAVGTPVVAIFGPGDPARTGPFGEGHIVLHGDQRLPFSGPSVDPGPARVDAPMGATRAATVLSSLSGH